MPYGRLMWPYALWGLIGAACNRALIFLDANRRVKGSPLQYPEGPGATFFLFAAILHGGIASAVAYAAAASGVISSPLLALGVGFAAPEALKAVSRRALLLLYPGDGGQRPGPGDRVDTGGTKVAEAGSDEDV
jgi:hypothetical protein